MGQLSVKQLKAQARKQGIPRYYQMLKPELIKTITPPTPNMNILDEPIPEINVPILKPSQPIRNSPVPSLKHLAKKEIINFSDWILSYIPEPIKKTADERVDSLKEKINLIFKKVDQLTPREQETALAGYLKPYRIDGQIGYGPKTFFINIKTKVLNLINKQKKPIKVKFILTCKLIKENPATGQIDENSGYFHSNVEIITDSTDFYNSIIATINQLLELIEQFQNQGTGWQFDQVEYFDINIDPFEPLSGSSYIPLPKKLSSKKAIINVKNEKDHECFKWAVTSAVFPKKKDAQRLNDQMRENSDNFDWSGIEFPVSLKQIDKFEKQNPYAINVYRYEGDKVYTLRISKKQGHVINLILLSNDETNHYCWIKNMSRLLSSQVNNYQHKRIFYYRCLNSFQSETSLERHTEYCSKNEAIKIEIPPIDKDGNPSNICFKNYNRKMRVPFVVYADFESFTENIDSCSPYESRSFTKQYQKHKASSYCYLIKCFDDCIFTPKLVHHTAKSPEDIPQMFVENLESDIKKIYNNFKFPKKVQTSKKDEITYNNATHCDICKGELGEDKVLDHCHLTGKYRGAAHNECTLQYKVPKFFPVIFHNLPGYDSHLFKKKLGTSEGRINCIPNNKEKYISFTKQLVVDTFTNKEGKKIDVKRDIRFIDSFRFMATSLDSLVSNLPKESFKNLTRYYEGEQLQLLLTKGVFPYDWCDSIEKLTSTQLPPKEAFYSKLNDTNITEDDYQHAQKVWLTFNMKTMRHSMD